MAEVTAGELDASEIEAEKPAETADLASAIQNEATTPSVTETPEAQAAEVEVPEGHLSQEKVGELISKTRTQVETKVRAEYADYDAVKGQVGELTTERDSLKTEKASLEAQNLRLSVAIEKRLPAQMIKRLQGTSKQELEADADELLGSIKPGQTQNFGGGAKESAPEKQDTASWLGGLVQQKS